MTAANAAAVKTSIPQVRSPQTVRVSVVQGNVPQEEKWDEAYRGDILARYTTLTEASAATDPALIVWPETSVPGYFTIDEVVFAEPGDLALLGARTLEGLNLAVDTAKKKLVAAGPLPAA